jgi:hypothetical protein
MEQQHKGTTMTNPIGTWSNMVPEVEIVTIR